MIDAYVLAAGRGERLWPLSSLLPKVLWPVGYKPAIRWVVEQIGNSKYVDSVHICCLQKDMPYFEHEFRDTAPTALLPQSGYRVLLNPTDEPMGTAGQIPKELVAQKDFLVWYGDCLFNFDLDSVYESWTFVRKNLGFPSAMVILTRAAKSDYGRVQLVGPNPGDIADFEEKPNLGETWTGIALIGGEVSEYLGPGKDFAKDVFPQLLREGKTIYGQSFSTEYYEIGNIASYRRANEAALKGALFK